MHTYILTNFHTVHQLLTPPPLLLKYLRPPLHLPATQCHLTFHVITKVDDNLIHEGNRASLATTRVICADQHFSSCHVPRVCLPVIGNSMEAIIVC